MRWPHAAPPLPPRVAVQAGPAPAPEQAGAPRRGRRQHRAPPAEEVEVAPPPPIVDMVWIKGHWHWNGAVWEWRRGHYGRPRVGWRWVPAHYSNRGGAWVYIGAHWAH